MSSLRHVGVCKRERERQGMQRCLRSPLKARCTLGAERCVQATSNTNKAHSDRRSCFSITLIVPAICRQPIQTHTKERKIKQGRLKKISTGHAKIITAFDKGMRLKWHRKSRLRTRGGKNSWETNRWRGGREMETVRFRQTEQKANVTTVLYYTVVYLAWSINSQTNPSLSHLPWFNSMQRQRFQACIRGSAFMLHGVSFILGKTGGVNHLHPPGATAQTDLRVSRLWAVVCDWCTRSGSRITLKDGLW